MTRKLIKTFGIIVITMLINITLLSCVDNTNTNSKISHNTKIQQKVTTSKVMKCLESSKVPMTGTSSYYVIMQDTKTSKRYFVVFNINGGTEIQPLD